ncbi:sensor histidine kinase [Rubripirellula reticaptiva]|nr:ATP-binding protein [Rubripirellula reticaptiva]
MSKFSHAKDLDKLEQRLAQAQKLESIGELAAGIAHEINTPIQYVGDNTRFVQEAFGGLALLLADCQNFAALADQTVDLAEAANRLRLSIDSADVDYLIEEIPAAISQTLEGVDRVAKIVRAMKEFAHPGVSEMAQTDLCQAINNTVMVARNEWKYVATIETDFDSTLGPVQCFPGELNQVLLNLIVNAAHAIGESMNGSADAKGCITISTKRCDEQAEIRVADTGRGITPENLAKVFSPFFTTKAAGKGTGQGLAIAHSVIVEKHAGTIDVASVVGQGTVFTIRLPLQRPKQVTAPISGSLVASPFEAELTS